MRRRSTPDTPSTPTTRSAGFWMRFAKKGRRKALLFFGSFHHPSSLSSVQSAPNADGSYTFVIASRDPGVRNWVDTAGLHEGSLFIRWQKLPQPLNPGGNAVREVKVVKLSDLAAALPADAQKVTSKERKKLLLERAAASETFLGAVADV